MTRLYHSNSAWRLNSSFQVPSCIQPLATKCLCLRDYAVTWHINFTLLCYGLLQS